ncbi:hypothetical protein TNIN_134381 [Trichonephila inaurata madagascariensis]|uniref:Uncharacterized protein n=1 Tax=Trichonephila inaurata madagascariensis TaxID=2747483 RepID=A0A8X6IXE9_9ARAC|nr:hypothetical protein TNIN_134381 [Trichonephila inaurata madagascariensis]
MAAPCQALYSRRHHAVLGSILTQAANASEGEHRSSREARVLGNPQLPSIQSIPCNYSTLDLEALRRRGYCSLASCLPELG